MPLLYNVRNNVSREGLKLIYNSLIYPLLMYCNVVWGSCCQSYLNNLNTIQKKIIRIMSFKGKFEHTAPLFIDFNVLTMGNINKYMCLLYVHRCLHEEGNDVFSPYEVINYLTRLANSNSLTIPDVRSTHSRQSVRWLGSRLWNTLPSHVKEIISYETFKFNVKKLLLLEQNWIFLLYFFSRQLCYILII